MNKKADKSQLKFPPLLNLAKDRPHIDSSFQNWEKVNGPYLNSMIQPVWTKSDRRKMVCTKNGDKFFVANNRLYINGAADTSTTISNQYFTREKTNIPKSAIAAFITEYGPVYAENDNGDIRVNYKYISLRPDSINGNIVDARFLSVGSTNTRLVIVYQFSGSYYVKVYRVNVYPDSMDIKHLGTLAVTWRCNIPGTIDATNQVTRTNLSLLSGIKADPVITGHHSGNIVVDGEGEEDAWFFTLTTSYGEVEDTKRNGFFTFMEHSDSLRALTTFELPKNNSAIAQQTLKKTVFITTSMKDSSVTKLYLSSDGNTYYEYIQNSANPKGPQFNFPTGVIPQNANRSITIDEGTTEEPNLVTYKIYSITISSRTRTATLNGDPTDNFTFKWKVAPTVPLNQIEVTSGTIDASGYIISSGEGTVNLTYVLSQYSTQANITAGWDSNVNIEFKYNGRTYTLSPSAYLNNAGGYQFEVVTSYTSSGYSKIVPTISLDDGYFYSLWTDQINTKAAVDQNQQWNSKMTSDAPLICMKAYDEIVTGATLRFGSQQVNTNQYNNGCYFFRSNSFAIDQGFFTMTAKFNNGSAANPRELSNSGKEKAGAMFSEWTYNNRYGFRYLPGTARLSSFNYYSYEVTGDPTLIGSSEDLLVYTVGGYRVPIVNSSAYKFKLLYNVTSSGFAYIQGISWSSAENSMGTLLTPWESVNETSYVSSNGNSCLYKDKADDWYILEVKTGENELSTLLEDRYLLINTTSYLNMYDSETGKWYHYASDYNGRMFHGQTANAALNGVLATSSTEYAAYPYMRYTANAINPLYQVMPRDAITSMILPITARYRCGVTAEQLFDCVTPNYSDIQGVDVFWSEFANTTCKYRRTLNLLQGVLQAYVKSELTGLLYPGSTSTSATLTPNIFTKYVNGAGNNDIVIENYDSYVLTYYDNRPYFLYSASTQVSTTFDERNEFFVLQGQFYGVIGDKLYSLIYSNGAISQMDAIIDVRGLIFLGNNPMISFFYDPAHRVIKTFTGDANLETFLPATKIAGLTGLHFYDTQTQSIYIPTPNGLFVIGPRNMYLFEQWKNVSLVQFDENGITHITNGNETISLVYYEREGFEPVPLDLESSFYGYGATENVSIDRWNITVYDPAGNHKDSYVTVGVRSLTDVSVKSEEKTYKIAPNMYDKWSNSVLIAYNPKLIKAQGLRLYVKTPLVVQSITAHVMDNGIGTLTKHTL